MHSISLYPDATPRTLAPITLDEQITGVQRELAVRAAVYPRQVARGHLTQPKADYQLAVMEAVLVTLQRLQDAQRASSREVYP
jgi:hypothetical protein